MNDSSFVDYYDLMQISPNADQGTIHQVFRHLAKKWHPDSPSGDSARFRLLVTANKTLRNPEIRAAYDIKYQKYWDAKWNLAADAFDKRVFVDDNEVREALLSLYYVQRRNKLDDPGLGELEVARLMRIPINLIEFHIWYLKGKGWVERLENGQFALTVLGVDEVEKNRLQLHSDRLLEADNSGFDKEAWEVHRKPAGTLSIHS